MTAELYFSNDVESDGPIPGPYSMISLGACAPGYRTGKGLIVRCGDDPMQWASFYAEIAPISDLFVPEALAVSGLDRDKLIATGQAAHAAMTTYTAWVNDTCTQLADQVGEKVRPVFAAYPLGFDFGFVNWYLINFTGQSPFGHSTHIDMKTEFASKARRGIVGATKRNMPRWLLGRGEHTHNALDDAREQGDMLMNLLDWVGDA